MDREYAILDFIEMQSRATQREIATATGFSLGSVNLLLNKMMREGLIKIELVPKSRIIYMLTPSGIREKLVKAYTYIRIHYETIERTKNLIKEGLNELKNCEFELKIQIDQKELRDITLKAMAELGLDEGVTWHNDVLQSTPTVILTDDESRVISTADATIINIYAWISEEKSHQTIFGG
jgi:DNA-binding MarR family transcriptional regulator